MMVNTISLQELPVVDYDPFAGPEIINIAPATASQKEIWASCALGGDAANRAFNESLSLRFSGNADTMAMEEAVQMLINRHESLRSVFSANGKNLCVLHGQNNQFQYTDISDFSVAEKEEIIAQQAKREVFKIFDLTNGPLFGAEFLKLSSNEYYLTLTAHHIICDGWSLSLILQDLGKIYSALVKNTYPDLSPAPSFCKYANEQFQFHGSKEYEEIEKFWVNEYKDDVPVLNLPTDFPRPGTRTYKSNRLDFKIDKEVSAALKRVGAKAGSSFVTTLSTAFEVFLYKLSGQKTISLGLPAADQAASGNVNLVGHCVNLLPLKSTIDPSAEFLAHLRQRKKTFLDSFEHQQLTFGSLLKQLNVARDPSRIPLVPVIFNVDMGMSDGVDFYGLTYEFKSNPREFETFEIFLNISGSENALTFEWSFNTQLFLPATIERMMNGFSSLLQALIENPLIEIKNIPLTSQKGLSSTSPQWNVTSAAYSRNTPLHVLIDETATKFPGKTAVTFNEKSISFKDLNIKANQLSHYLIKQNIKRGDVVGVGVDRSVEMIISLLAVMKTGAAYVPIDPEYPDERINYMLADSAAKMFITSKKHQQKFAAGIIKCIVEDAIKSVDGFSGESPNVPVSGDDLAYILYTSGSTGKPKGVLIEQHNLVNMLQSVQVMPGMNENDVLLAITTVSFDIFCVEIFLPLITGATIVLADSTTTRDGREILRLIKNHQVSILQATPATWKMILAAGWSEPLQLKALCGGEAMTKDLAGKILARCTSLFNMYGPTETTVYSTGKQIFSNDELITIGKPINNTQIYIVDESLAVVPEGVAGEICIAGEGVGRGYRNLEILTSEKFIENSSIAGKAKKMYRTGDLGKFLSNGEIQCFGRIDRQLKIRGFRIEPGEIETAILKNQTCKEVVVTARGNKISDQNLVAYIVTQNNYTTNFSLLTKQLREQLKQQLPVYMIPNRFIEIDSVPLLPNGKTDFNALPDIISTEENAEVSENAVLTATEQMVSSIWKKSLGLSVINIDDNFFELGGHSIMAVQVVVKLEKETGKMLPVSTLLTYSTVRQLAALLDSGKNKIQWKSLVPIKASGTKPPLYIVHGAGLNVLIFKTLAKEMGEDQPVYGFQAKGLDGADEPLERIEDMAAFYISEMIQQNPDGPYVIAGYSFGGLIAFEMAKQLTAMNKKVKMLAMFDSYAYQSDYFKPFYKKFPNKGYSLFMKLAYTFILLLKEPKATAVNKIDFVRRQFNSLTYKVLDKAPDDKYYTYTKKIADKNVIAFNHFKLTPYEGSVDIFKANKNTFYVPDFKYLGWKPFALKGVRVHKIPGEHKDLLLPPNVKTFAEILNKALASR